jgi:hypothetical protein
MNMHVFECVCVCVCVFFWMCVCINIYTRVGVCVCVCMNLNVCECVLGSFITGTSEVTGCFHGSLAASGKENKRTSLLTDIMLSPDWRRSSTSSPMGGRRGPVVYPPLNVNTFSN